MKTSIGTYQIAQHRDEDRRLTWVEVQSENYRAGFQVVDGELMETVDFATHRVPGFPNFASEEAGVVEWHRANDPELVDAVMEMFGIVTDRQRLRRALDEFKLATRRLSDAWDADELQGDEIDNYPECLPSFDEFAILVGLMEVKPV